MKTKNIAIVTLCMVCVGLSPWVRADDPPAKDKAAEQVIQPKVDRRDVTSPHIRANDFEFGGYFGVLSVEDFGSDSVKGARLAYHVSEDFFVEGVLGSSYVSDEQYRTLLPSGVFEKPKVDLKYYLVSIGYHFLPGEVFMGKNYAFGSGVYLIGGLGNVKFADVSSSVLSVGLGVRALPTDWLSLRVEMRDHMFDQDILGKNKLTHNFEMTFGLSAYF